MNYLTDSELQTLLSMARACKSLADGQDVISLFALLDELLKPQLKQALKGLPAATKKLLRDAAISEQGVAA